jgi:DNA-binding transcriptional regulator YiaG
MRQMFLSFCCHAGWSQKDFATGLHIESERLANWEQRGEKLYVAER